MTNTIFSIDYTCERHGLKPIVSGEEHDSRSQEKRRKEADEVGGLEMEMEMEIFDRAHESWSKGE